jgi:general secretion pathway protein I
MSYSPHQGARGFTLVEVLIAVLVVALGIGALLSTVSASATAIARLRDKSFAQWIALNQISTQRLSGAQPSVGVTYGTIDFAGGSWRWQQEVTDPGVAGIVRVEVRVAQLVKGAEAPSQPLGDTPMPSVGSAYGFLGSSSARPSGQSPDWSFDSIPAGGAGGGGGRGAGGGTGASGGGPAGAGGISGGGGMSPLQVP